MPSIISHGWTAGSGAIFDLTSNELRPDYWTSADAAGLPIFPGLVRYEEVVEKGEINHALRFTVSEYPECLYSSGYACRKRQQRYQLSAHGYAGQIESRL